MQQLFRIDGAGFSVGVVSLKRSAKLTDGGNTGTMLSGETRRDLLGVYYDYTLTLDATGLSRTEYDTLYDILTAPQDSHSVTMPYGQGSITFDAEIESAEDELLYADGAGRLWGELEVTFTATRPYRVPDE